MIGIAKASFFDTLPESLSLSRLHDEDGQDALNVIVVYIFKFVTLNLFQSIKG